MEQHLKNHFKKTYQIIHCIEIVLFIVGLFFECYNVYNETNVNLFFLATTIYILNNYFQIIKMTQETNGILPYVFLGSISALGIIIVIEFLSYVVANVGTSILPIKTPVYVLYFVVFISEIYKLTIEYKPPSK